MRNALGAGEILHNAGNALDSTGVSAAMLELPVTAIQLNHGSVRDVASMSPLAV